MTISWVVAGFIGFLIDIIICQDCGYKLNWKDLQYLVIALCTGWIYLTVAITKGFIALWIKKGIK